MSAPAAVRVFRSCRTSSAAILTIALACSAAPGTAGTFEQWRDLHLPVPPHTPDARGADADPDRDGLTNFIEYCIGTNPTAADPHPGLRFLDADATGAMLCYPVAGGLVNAAVLLQSSSDLIHWVTHNAPVSPAEAGERSTRIAAQDAASGTFVARLWAVDAAAAGAWELPPDHLDARAEPPLSVRLAWTDRSPCETGHLVERLGADGSWMPIVETPADCISCSDPTVDAGVTARYRVRAIFDGGRLSDSGAETSVCTPHDTDCDGLSDVDEPRYGTDPGQADSDGDGMADGMEIGAALNPLHDDACADPDRDGLLNDEEIARGADPQRADTDGDTVPDALDAVPYDPAFTFAPAPESRYAIVDLGPGRALAIDAQGRVLALDPSGESGTLYGPDEQRVSIPFTPLTCNDSGAVIGHSATLPPRALLLHPGPGQCEPEELTLPEGMASPGDQQHRYVVQADLIDNNGRVFGHASVVTGEEIECLDCWLPMIWDNEPLHAGGGNDCRRCDGRLALNPWASIERWTRAVAHTTETLVFEKHYEHLGGAGGDPPEAVLVDFYHAVDGTPLPHANHTLQWTCFEAVDNVRVATGWALGSTSACEVALKTHDGTWKHTRLRNARDRKRVVPISVRCVGRRGQMLLSGGRLWRNGAVYTIDELAGGALQAGGYAGIALVDMDEAGLIAATGVQNAGGADRALLLVPIDLVPDYDRNGAIDAADRARIAPGRPWRWWTNDDDDTGDLSNGDEPLGHSSPSADCVATPQTIDGSCDLIDLFPLAVDLGALGRHLPLAACKIRIRHPAGALRFTTVDLPAGEAGGFLTDPDVAGAVIASQLKTAGADGATLDAEAVAGLEDSGRGILLVEARRPSAEPLVVEVLRDEKLIGTVTLPVRVDSVERMYRWINLRSVVGQAERRPTDISEPSNRPDATAAPSVFVLVHGYNITENESRGWCAETFKRLHQSGSNAKFIGVSWHGDASRFGALCPDYWENVAHALLTAPQLAAHAGAFSGGRRVLCAHSLGSLLAASALARHGLESAALLMFNAAAPIEAFDPGAIEPVHMLNESWAPNDTPFPRRLWASEWHTLFNPTDGRATLTWRALLGAHPRFYNFYSSGEDVLDNTRNGACTLALGGTNAWTDQELLKGTTLQWLAGWSSHAGWGFNDAYRDWTPQEAEILTVDVLRTAPFFKPLRDTRLLDPGAGSASAREPELHARCLAEEIPALSFAAGRNPIGALDAWGDDRNVDLMSLQHPSGAWPQCRLTDPARGSRWLHGDLLAVAYLFNFRCYHEIVEIGQLK